MIFPTGETGGNRYEIICLTILDGFWTILAVILPLKLSFKFGQFRPHCFLFPVRCAPQKGFSRNLWAGIQIWVNQLVLKYTDVYIKLRLSNEINRYL